MQVEFQAQLILLFSRLMLQRPTLEGEAELELVGATNKVVRQRMAPDHSYRVPAGQRHRLRALTPVRILEVSTPELEDVVRWEDDYGRVVGAAG